ncbi:MAG: bifunctional DNA-formamidopyrimidine glycosylase/DNA-(apurinic or apyrimidinic site) lyase [Patescibacteria group bacterium]
MPELPEVETIRRGLEKRIVGRNFVDIDVRFPKSFIGKKEDVIGQKVIGINRRAKVLGIKIDNGLTLLFHLKMTGQLIYRAESLKPKAESDEIVDFFAGGHPDHEWHKNLPDKTTAIVFTFDDGSVLYFNDMRKFGWCKVLTPQSIEALNAEYGPEPFDSGFNAEYLMFKASKIPNRNIKQFLTDQAIVAGIGNIYVDEILFDTRISPLRKVKDIKLSEWKKVVESTKKILELGIKYGGTTDSDYVNADGKKGGMQDHLKVYHHTGEACPAGCGGKVERISVGGRGTHYCPDCQK